MDVSYTTGLEDGTWTANVEVRYGRRHQERPARVWFKSADEFTQDGSFLIPFSLLPAMQRGENLTLDPSIAVSPALLSNLEQIQTLFLSFGPSFGHRLKRVKINATAGEVKPMPASRGAACFFSGGIDSFYSALKHINELDALIFIRGFDTRLDKLKGSALEEQTADVRRAASELGVRLVEVTTNARNDFADASLHWELYHGGLLASIAHLLSPNFKRFYIASSYPYEFQGSCGSHPLLDPLWASEDFEIVHDGGEVDRWDKLKAITDNPVVQRHLHPCWKNEKGFENCGVCSSCVRAMAVLKFLGKSELFTTFPPTFDLSLLGTGGFDSVDELRNTYSLWKFVKSDPELAAAVRDNLMAVMGRLQAELASEAQPVEAAVSGA